MRKWSKGFFIALIALLMTVLPVAVVSAAGNNRSYQYVIGTGPLCELPLPDPCPTIAMAKNGDTVAVTGQGTFGTRPRSATGGGTFVHRHSDGTLVANGTWTATRLLGFKSYGNDPANLPPNFVGGLALMQVRLYVGGNLVATGILQIDCEIGKVPAGHHEGIRLVVQGTQFNFNHKVSGLTLFILVS